MKYDRFIWIDSICIDQENDAEKNVQISFMRHIYKEAKNVLIWLGDATAAEEGALAIMPAVTTILERVAADGPDIDPEKPETFDMVGLPPPSHPFWPALGTLMNRAWFRRLWALQEVVLPEKTRVMCGQKETSWEILAAFGAIVSKAYQQRIINWTITGEPNVEAADLHGYDALRVVDYCRQSIKVGVMGIGLDILLCATRRRQVTNRVDMIFGMLGMAAPGLTKELVIDVSAPPSDVYLAFARYYIRHEANECLLNYNTYRDRLDSLPTWCPNFGLPGNIYSLGSRWWNDRMVQETPHSQNYHAGFTKLGKWQIPIIDNYLWSAMGAAVRQRTMKQNFYDTPDPRQISLTLNPKHIRASGMVIDVIVQIVACNNGAEDHTTKLSSTLQTLEWESLCLMLAKETLEDSAEVPETYWRTLLGNQTGGNVDEKDIIWDRFEKVDMLENYHGWKRWMIGVIREGKLSSFMNTTEYRTRWYGILVSRITRGRCFFATRDGRIGLGPAESQIGDTVCVFFYCPTPYILRTGSAVQEFIGEAYVHGLMYAEALDMLDEGKIEETQFFIG